MYAAAGMDSQDVAKGGPGSFVVDARLEGSHEVGLTLAAVFDLHCCTALACAANQHACTARRAGINSSNVVQACYHGWNRCCFVCGAQVLRIPVIRQQTLKRLVAGIGPRPPLLGAPCTPTVDDTLGVFMQRVGSLLGKDPSKWEQTGEVCHSPVHSYY